MKQWMMAAVLLVLAAPVWGQEAPDSSAWPPLEVIVDEIPEPLNLAKIKRKIGYPNNAWRAGMQGTVVVRVLVGTEGQAEAFVIVQSTHAYFSEAVAKHVLRLKFRPALKDGNPVRVWVHIPFQFMFTQNSG